MKKWLLIGMTLVIVLSGVLVGCGEGESRISGKYVHEDDPESYLELYNDGTFYLYYDPGLDLGTHTGFRGGLSGEYKVQNDTVIISSELGAARLWINDDILWDEQDNRWIKEDKHTKGETSTPSLPAENMVLTPKEELIDIAPDQILNELEGVGTTLQKQQVWEKYDGKRVRWSVQLSHLDTVDDAIIGLCGWPRLWITEWHVIKILFRDDESDRLSGLSEGEMITIEGTLVYAQGLPENISEKYGIAYSIRKVIENAAFGLVDGIITKSEDTVEPASAPESIVPSTLEVANLGWSDLNELGDVINEVLTISKLISDEDEIRLLIQADTILDALKRTPKQDIIREKTEEERFILDVLGGIFSIGAQQFYNIPSPIAWAISKGAEELGNRIAEWQVLGQLGSATLSKYDSGVMEIVYLKEQGEIWVNFETFYPVGRICMYIPVEPALVSSEGGGNIILSEGVKPTIANCKVVYRYDIGIIIDPPIGPVDTPVTITGNSFVANTAITAQYDGVALPIEGGHTTTQTDGTFSSTVYIPESTAGSHTITVTVGTTSVSSTFTVTRDIIINPQSGTAGTQVTISGTGFVRRPQATFYFNGSQIQGVSSLLSDSKGSFSAIITIPSGLDAGVYTIEADDGTDIATAIFTLNVVPQPEPEPEPEPTPPSSLPTLTISSSGNTIGSNIGIGGAGFLPYAIVTIKWDDKEVASVTADADGLVMALFKIPACIQGDHIITVSDGTNTGKLVFRVES